jgi:hypothetical protein
MPVPSLADPTSSSGTGLCYRAVVNSDVCFLNRHVVERCFSPVALLLTPTASISRPGIQDQRKFVPRLGKVNARRRFRGLVQRNRQPGNASDFGGLIDLNTGRWKSWIACRYWAGIAQRIIEYREVRGFKSVEQITEVSGIMMPPG